MSEEEDFKNPIQSSSTSGTPQQQKNHKKKLGLVGLITIVGLISVALIVFSPTSTGVGGSGVIMLAGFLLLLNFIPAIIGFVLSLISFFKEIKLRNTINTIINLVFVLIFAFLPFVFFILVELDSYSRR